MDSNLDNAELDNLEIQARHWMHDYKEYERSPLSDNATRAIVRAYKIIHEQRHAIRRLKIGQTAYSSVEPTEVAEDARRTADALTKESEELGVYDWQIKDEDLT